MRRTAIATALAAGLWGGAEVAAQDADADQENPLRFEDRTDVEGAPPPIEFKHTERGWLRAEIAEVGRRVREERRSASILGRIADGLRSTGAAAGRDFKAAGRGFKAAFRPISLAETRRREAERAAREKDRAYRRARNEDPAAGCPSKWIFNIKSCGKVMRPAMAELYEERSKARRKSEEIARWRAQL